MNLIKNFKLERLVACEVNIKRRKGKSQEILLKIKSCIHIYIREVLSKRHGSFVYPINFILFFFLFFGFFVFFWRVFFLWHLLILSISYCFIYNIIIIYAFIMLNSTIDIKKHMFVLLLYCLLKSPENRFKSCFNQLNTSLRSLLFKNSIYECINKNVFILFSVL